MTPAKLQAPKNRLKKTILFMIQLNCYICNKCVLACVMFIMFCSLISQHNLSLSKAIQEDPLYEDICEKLTKSKSLQEMVYARTSVLQVHASFPMLVLFNKSSKLRPELCFIPLHLLSLTYC